eukprot:GDKI01042146.1.p1 GENE.GDKI01042146.1~~GDKI01042146.1.p1  ORF type:complete len:108 (-),score=17.21 GDKI01042146.1:97-420(-)
MVAHVCTSVHPYVHVFVCACQHVYRGDGLSACVCVCVCARLCVCWLHDTVILHVHKWSCTGRSCTHTLHTYGSARMRFLALIAVWLQFLCMTLHVFAATHTYINVHG